eukprot:Pompholyxophrys_punicea_v1_NODE_441_length_1962_cov_16.704248.p1 type:complete len:301 gc:universal NODE_441_length_1962_cov_16.704248:295-1197(+)
MEEIQTSGASTGRKKKHWNQIDRRAKEIRTKALRDLMSEYTEEEILFCLSIRKISIPQRMSSDEALALVLDCDLSQTSYQLIRNNALQHGIYLYPPFNEIREAKKRTYTSSEKITEISAESSLQALLDKTTERLFLAIQEPLAFVVDVQKTFNFTFIHKWGFDGASSQTLYKQLWSNSSSSDATLISTNLVPLRFFHQNSSTGIIWNNPTPSSTLFCRPLRLQFKKESQEFNIEEKDYWQAQIDTLLPTKLEINGKSIQVTHKLMCTMVDGKVVGHITNTHTTKCVLCKATPSQMNRLDL